MARRACSHLAERARAPERVCTRWTPEGLADPQIIERLDPVGAEAYFVRTVTAPSRTRLGKMAWIEAAAAGLHASWEILASRTASEPP